MAFAGVMAIAMVVDALLGWPNSLFTRVGHPVTWIGRLIEILDAGWNRTADAPSKRRASGVAAALVMIVLAGGTGWLLQNAMPSGWRGTLIAGILAWPFVALRSLHEHVVAVAHALRSGDLAAARSAVSKIVGRDPAKLDQPAIARAAIESLAENTSDGVVAPVFWGALLGLPGIIGYKAINTLDSMIGHRTERHASFGWAAARIDDVANFVPARITGLLFAMLGPRPKSAFTCMRSDAPKHRSINAGWPEAAMAGALSVRLCGPRFYHSELTDEPWLNGSARDPDTGDVALALRLYVRAMTCLVGLLAVLAFI